jgi:hypothetical protein
MTAILGQPVVVRPADRSRDPRFDLIVPDNIKAEGGKQNCDVDAFAVHVAQVRSRIKAVGNAVGEDGPVQRVLGK